MKMILENDSPGLHEALTLLEHPLSEMESPPSAFPALSQSRGQRPPARVREDRRSAHAPEHFSWSMRESGVHAGFYGSHSHEYLFMRSAPGVLPNRA